MTKGKQRQLYIVALSSVLSLMLTNHIINGPTKLDSMSTMASRTTELGKAKATTKSGKTEIDLKLKDPAIASMWGLKTANAQEAWNKLKAYGSRDIIVAVIDTGIDVQHPDLQRNLWTNKGEVGFDKKGKNKATNGVDDDGNGYVDDVHGWNFVSSNNSLKDNHGHGTHIAGIIGAVGGNGIGISGVSPKVSLMVLKYYDPKAPGMNNLMNTVKAIDYAVKNNASIINYSGGGLDPSDLEKAAISRAQKKGILFVAAAGNERSNSDIKHYYPADYNLDNIISVTAIDAQKKILPTSNYGANTVDIAAPGNDILSTLPKGKYGKMTGTSQATAFVTGVAALVMDKYRDLEAKKVIRHLTVTGDLDQRLSGKTVYRKRINTYRALAILDQGISATGAVVKNTAVMKKNQFAREDNDKKIESSLSRNDAPEMNGEQSLSNIAQFGKSMQEALAKTVEQQKTIPPGSATGTETTAPTGI